MKDKTYIIIILLIVIGGIIMTGIVHNRVVASRDKGMAADWNANHDITSDVDMGQFSWKNQVIENLNAFPGGPVEGQQVYRADLDAVYVYDGTGWSRSNKRVLYWSCGGVAFSPRDNVMAYDYSFNYGDLQHTDVGSNGFIASVNLPDGAVVTKAVVYGSNTDNFWYLRRGRITAEELGSMASGPHNTEDATIQLATIDNNTYFYYIYAFLGQNDKIYGARIEYTL